MKKEEILFYLKENPFLLAPMASITDHSYRSFMKQMSAGIVFSELISATGIMHGSQKTLQLMNYDESHRPFGVQLFGEKIDHMVFAAQVVESRGADFVDINVGCPVPKVTKKGAGSALLKDLPQLKKMIRQISKSIQIPLTMKIRTGWDEKTKNPEDIVKIADDEGLLWVCIHGRTRAQNYRGQADWNLISDIKQKFKNVVIIGNGDISSAEMAVKRLESSGCEGVMIGRGALKNPWIFSEALHLLKQKKNPATARNYLDTFQRLVESHNKYCEQTKTLQQIKKLVVWMATGYPEASLFRKKIFTTKESTEIEALFQNFFSQKKERERSEIDFLMGGHG